MPLRPEVPTAPHLPVQAPPGSETTCACRHTSALGAPAPRRTSLPTVSAGAVGLALLGGVVLTGLLTAVAVSAVSVAVAAVVLRSLLNSQHHKH